MLGEEGYGVAQQPTRSIRGVNDLFLPCYTIQQGVIICFFFQLKHSNQVKNRKKEVVVVEPFVLTQMQVLISMRLDHCGRKGTAFKRLIIKALNDLFCLFSLRSLAYF